MHILSFLLVRVYSKQLMPLVVLLTEASRAAGVRAGYLGHTNQNTKKHLKINRNPSYDKSKKKSPGRFLR